jgi:hypothetical protein
MSAGTRAATGNELFDQVVYLPSVTYPTLAANASGSNTVAVPGALVGDIFSWNMQSPPAHLVLDNVYVSAAGVVTLLWSTDGTGISTGSVAVLFSVVRPENASLGLASLPNSLI